MLSQNEFTLVDNVDYEWLNKWKWHILSRRSHYGVYVIRRVGSGNQYMHRAILGLEFGDGKQVDHRDGNGLNNQQSNLRICTKAQNMQNAKKHSIKTTSKYKGVHWRQDACKWQARIYSGGKRISLGHFSSELAAAQAYNWAALKHFGEFAKINEITTKKLSRVERIGWQSI